MLSHRWSVTPLMAALLLALLPATSLAQIVPYTQDFEDLVQTSTTALGDEGWLVFGNVYQPDGETYLYGYGPFPAPNDPLAPAFCNIALLEGGTEQGLQQLVVISDYNNLDHAIGNVIEANVFREWPITADNVGEVWAFQFDAKLGNIVAPSTAGAFIKTIDPNNNFFATNFLVENMTNIPTTWGTYSVTLDITEELVGQIFQIGFINTATNYDPSGIFYDNVNLFVESTVDAPSAPATARAQLGENYPNPFNPSTQIEFSLPQAGSVELMVYDLAGRHVATLKSGHVEAGSHTVQWDGRSDAGVPVASGHYRYVLRSDQGTVARAMTLIK